MRTLGHGVQKRDFVNTFGGFMSESPRTDDRQHVTSPDLHTPAVNKSSAAPPAARFLSMPGCKG